MDNRIIVVSIADPNIKQSKTEKFERNALKPNVTEFIPRVLSKGGNSKKPKVDVYSEQEKLPSPTTDSNMLTQADFRRMLRNK